MDEREPATDPVSVHQQQMLERCFNAPSYAGIRSCDIKPSRMLRDDMYHLCPRQGHCIICHGAPPQ